MRLTSLTLILATSAQLGSTLGNRAARATVAASGRAPAIAQRYQVALRNAAAELPYSVACDHGAFDRVNHLPGLDVYPPVRPRLPASGAAI